MMIFSFAFGYLTPEAYGAQRVFLCEGRCTL